MILQDTLCRSGVFVNEFCRPNRARYEAATTIRADAMERIVNAVFAKRTFKRADHCVLRIKRQVTIAALAVRTQFEDNAPLSPAAQSCIRF